MKKRFRRLCIYLLVGILCVFFPYSQLEGPHSIAESYYTFSHARFACAKFDYRSDTGIETVIVTSRILHLSVFFQSLALEVTDAPFDEEWVFRILFNWNRICVNCEEVLVLVSESYIKIGDINYVSTGDASRLLGTVRSLFEYLRK